MKTTFKIISLALVILVVLFSTAILVLPTLVNTTTFKQSLTEQIESYTGQRLTIEGDLNLSVFPWLGIKTNKVTLSQNSALSSENLLEINSVKVGVKLLPLFNKQIEIDTVELDQPRIHYIVKKSGESSLDSFSAIKEKTRQEPTPRTRDTTKSNGTSSNDAFFRTLIINGFTLINGELIYDDQQSKQKYVVKNTKITIGTITELTHTPFSASASIAINEEEPILIKIESQVYADLENQQIKANNTSLQIENKTDKIISEVDLLSFDVKNQRISLNSLIATTQIREFSPRLSLSSAIINLKDYTTSSIPFLISDRLTNNSISGQALLKDWNDNAILKGEIQSDSIALLPILSALELNYSPSDSDALNKVGFSSQFTTSKNGFSLHKLLIKLDQTTLSGALSMIGFNKPRYRFDLSIDQLNIDRYLPTSKPTKAHSSLAITAPIPLFKHLNANGIFRAKELQANGAKINDLDLQILSKNNTVTIKPSAQLYGGTTNGTLLFTDNGSNSSLSIENTFSNINLEPLLIDTHITDQLTGLGNINIDIDITESKGIQTHTGTIISTINNGKIKGIDITRILDQIQVNLDKLRGKSSDTVDEGSGSKNDETSFTEMSATLRLNNNTISNDDLSIKAPALRISGKGSISLETESLDYLSNLTVVNTNAGQGGKDRKDLKGATIPVRFYGKLSNPDYKIDTRALIKENTKIEVDKQKEKLKQKIAEKIGLSDKITHSQDGDKISSKEESKDISTEKTEMTIEKTKETIKDDMKRKLIEELFN